MRAQQLLVNTDLGLGEIAACLGYSEASAFSRGLCVSGKTAYTFHTTKESGGALLSIWLQVAGTGLG